MPNDVPPSTEPGRRDQFPMTRWTLACQAQDATELSAHQALSQLCEMYW